MQKGRFDFDEYNLDFSRVAGNSAFGQGHPRGLDLKPELPFSTRELAALLRCSTLLAQRTLNCLRMIGIVEPADSFDLLRQDPATLLPGAAPLGGNRHRVRGGHLKKRGFLTFLALLCGVLALAAVGWTASLAVDAEKSGSTTPAAVRVARFTPASFRFPQETETAGRPETAPEAIVRLAKTFVVAAAKNLRDRFGVAIGGEDVEQLVEAHPERVHLPVREVLDAAAVEFDLEDGALGQAQRVTHLLGQGDLSPLGHCGFHRHVSRRKYARIVHT